MNCVTAKLFSISEGEVEKSGRRREGESGGGWRRGGGEKGLETRERDMNENAYAPRIHRVPLVFYFLLIKSRPGYITQANENIDYCVAKQCRDIIHYLHPSPTWLDHGSVQRLERHRDGINEKERNKKKFIRDIRTER